MKNVIKKIAIVLLVISFLPNAAFAATKKPVKKMVKKVTPVAQVKSCAKTVPFRIGTVDAKFGISNMEFQKLVRLSASQWNAAAGGPALVETQDAMLTVNLVYGSNQIALNNYFGIGGAPDDEANTLAQNLSTPNIKLGQYIEKKTKGVVIAKELNILAFNTSDDLKSTLLHELGHALGFGHIDTDGAVMSAETSDLFDQPQVLSAADKKLAKNYCVK